MSLLAQPWMVKTRNRVRNFGVARALYRRWMATFDYEERFGRELLDAIDSQSTVWDVGANVGLYTQKFLAKGARSVICVEPAPMAVESLRRRFAAHIGTDSRVVVLPVALSDASGTAHLAADGASPTNQIKSHKDNFRGLIEIPVRRADELIRNREAPIPNMMKIDVEGYELEVLRGLGDFIRSTELRAIFVEVHFALLNERGLDSAPKDIATLLGDSGFRVRWLDLSHICGIRN